MASSEEKNQKKTAKKKAAVKTSSKKAPAKKVSAKKAPAKKAARKKARKVKEIILSESQKNFIDEKVKTLGTVEKVRNLYSLDDNVCKYAINKAEELFGV